MNFAVLGCGPAGLLATHALVRAGHQVSVFSIKRPSVIGGAQYLHRWIPGITTKDPDGKVEYVKHGDAVGYATKVYGDENADTSWNTFSGTHEIWNMRAAYRKLWDLYVGRINHDEITESVLTNLVRNPTFDMVFSCIPAMSICINPEHTFELQSVYIAQEPAPQPHSVNRIIYDGTTFVSWYRQSVIFGVLSTEWAEKPTHHSEKLVRVNKPLRTDCTCWPELMRLGRYGAWQKKLLIHNAYEGALDALHSL